MIPLRPAAALHAERSQESMNNFLGNFDVTDESTYLYLRGALLWPLHAVAGRHSCVQIGLKPSEHDE